jgi:hypothetical protein
LPRAQRYFHDTLKVITPSTDDADVLHPFDETVQERCGKVLIPQTYFDKGLAAKDLVVFVTSYFDDSGTIAWAQICSQDEVGRPIAGQISFNTLYLTRDPYFWDQ